MKYYDVSIVEVPAWFGFNGNLKPVIIKAKTQNELRKKSRVKGLSVLKNPDSQVFRKAVDKALVDAILPDRLHGHDYLHHHRTILSNVTLKIMNKFNISLMFTFKELREAIGLDRAKVWGRMKYELWLCNKKKVPVIICSGAESPKDLVPARSLLALGELLGLRPEQAKKALNYVHEKILNR